MSLDLIKKVGDQQKKAAVTDVRTGDRVRVHQRIKEGGKERVQVFEGMVIRVTNRKTHLARIVVRRVASGVGVEKSFLLHSPLVEKVEVVRRSKVRRGYLSYMRDRRGKGERLVGIEFDQDAVNAMPEEPEEAEAEAEKQVEETDKKIDPKAKKESEAEAKPEPEIEVKAKDSEPATDKA